MGAENLNLYREAMHSFTELGFTFAIDDLGSGYSGLETLATLGATYLKIDMDLVRDVQQKPVSQQGIKAIVDMGAGVGAAVIAEGIQTQDEADAVIDLGVQFGQGYLWGAPTTRTHRAPVSSPSDSEPPEAKKPPRARLPRGRVVA
jgi:EAL domain-containing protein (putative c-di-GMP-specific phosphodiesterase class I)